MGLGEAQKSGGDHVLQPITQYISSYAISPVMVQSFFTWLKKIITICMLGGLLIADHAFFLNDWTYIYICFSQKGVLCGTVSIDFSNECVQV